MPSQVESYKGFILNADGGIAGQFVAGQKFILSRPSFIVQHLSKMWRFGGYQTAPTNSRLAAGDLRVYAELNSDGNRTSAFPTPSPTQLIYEFVADGLGVNPTPSFGFVNEISPGIYECRFIVEVLRDADISVSASIDFLVAPVIQ